MDGGRERAGARVAAGPMRNPTAVGPAARAVLAADGPWTARGPAGREGRCWAWTWGRTRCTGRGGTRRRGGSGGRGGAEHGGRDPAAAEAGAGQRRGGGADRAVRRAADPGGAGERSDGAAGG